MPLVTRVAAPTASAAAITAKPAVTSGLAPSGAALPGSPSAALRAVCSRVPASMPSTIPPISGSIRSPLPNESKPSTSWKYCGIANRMPNIANDTNVVSTVPQVNPAEQNSASWISGWPPRRVIQRSQATNATSSTAPATIVTTAVVSPQPSWPALMKP